MKKCLFAGSFDPFTVGHEGVVNRALDLFDEVVIALMKNPEKTTFFTVEERLSFLKACYGDHPRVTVIEESGLVVDVMQRYGIDCYVRGVRNGSDFDYETLNYYAAKRLDPAIQTVYFPAEQSLVAVSSTVVRLAALNGKPYAEYLPEKMREPFTLALKKRGL